MGKRKREKTNAETATKVGSSCGTALHSLLGKVSLKTWIDLQSDCKGVSLLLLHIVILFSVVQTLDTEKFMATHWERKPAVIKGSNDGRQKRLASLFTLSTLWDCVKGAQKTGVHYACLILPEMLPFFLLPDIKVASENTHMTACP